MHTDELNDSHLLSVKHGADHSDAVHQVAPLVNNQVLPSLQPVEQKISRPAKIQIQIPASRKYKEKVKTNTNANTKQIQMHLDVNLSEFAFLALWNWRAMWASIPRLK